jgi:NADH-quinone oxidoreductase subunit J
VSADFVIFGAIALAGGVGVVLLRSPIHAALALVAVFLSLAGTYFTLGAHFLGIIQVIVYAGAIMVLIIFVIMLLNVQDANPGGLDQLPNLGLAALVAVVVLGGAIIAAVATGTLPGPGPEAGAPALSGGTPDVIGGSLFRDHVVPFQIGGLLLLVAVVGAVVLVRRDEPPEGSK